jgi:hypothetical protein
MLKDLLCGLDFMSKSKNKSTSSPDVSTEKPPITIEEIDCERRGYKLTHKTLGVGAYAKVKLAYVSLNKKAKHPCLRTDLDNKDDNRVSICLRGDYENESRTICVVRLYSDELTCLVRVVAGCH